jgi:hypothetical protein
MKGRRQVKEELLSLDMDCVCMPFRGRIGKTQYVSVFE